MNFKSKTFRLTFLSLCIAIAMILGYVESILPFQIAVPGIKLGLPNLVIVWILYTYDFKDALLVSLLRVFLNALLFGNIYSFFFSFMGALLSLCSMHLLKKTKFHIIVVSMCGGIFHNLGQMLMAMFLTSAQMIYYLPLLLLSGMICGILNGIISKYVIAYLKV